MPSLRYRIALIFPIVACLTFASRHYRLDDALIYAVYVRNALEGHGLVFNVGVPINALTSPFFGFLLLAFSWLFHGHILIAELFLSSVFLAAACVLAEMMAPLAGLLLSSLSFFYLCFGMETSVFLFMLMLLLTLYVRNQFRWLPLVALLTMMTRFEGGALVALIAIDMVRVRRWPTIKSFVPPLVVTVLYLAANLRLYHRLLPGSLAAKFQQGESQLWGPWPKAFMYRPVQLLTAFAHCAYFMPVLAVLAFLAYRKLRGTALQTLIPQFLLVLLIFYLVFNIPNYHWYDAPLIFFGLLYAMLGVPKSGIAYSLIAIVIAGFFTAGMFYLPHQQQGWHDEYKQVAEWARWHEKPGAHLAAVETGTIAWYCHCYVEDIIGITDPQNGKFLAHDDLRSWILTDPPDLVVMHKPPIFGEVAAAESSDYQTVPFDAGHIYLAQRQEPGVSGRNRSPGAP